MSGKRTWHVTNIETPPSKRRRRNKHSNDVMDVRCSARNITLDTPNDDASSALTSGSGAKRDDRFVGLMQPLLQILECPVCMEMVDLTFKQCSRGHLVCDKCAKNKLSSCPVCRAKFISDSPVCMRNVIELLSINGIPQLVEQQQWK